MVAKLLDGTALAGQIKRELAQRVAAFGKPIGLGTILVGSDPGSVSYVNGKHRDCAEVGITSIRRELPASASAADVLKVVQELNADPACTGFIVQLPLPCESGPILDAMDPAKDADGLHAVNLGHLVLGEPGPIPCTPRAIVTLLNHYGVSLDGADVVVVGRGVTVGRPLGLVLSQKAQNATVTLTHTGTKDLKSHLKRADVVIAAVGVPGFITADSVKSGAVVVDVGITRTDLGLVGDVAPEVVEVASWLAPMPGGVGPMTRAMLLTNVVEAAGA